MQLPQHLKYTSTHEWALISDNEALIGLTEHAVNLLGDIVYLELPKMGAEVTQKISVGIVESVKAVSEIYSPLSGKVIAVNEALIKEPGLLNRECYDTGWLYRIALSHPEEGPTLLTADAYRTSLG